jgi:hypothetical protein
MHKLRIKKRDEMAVKAKRRRDNNEKHEGIKKKKTVERKTGKQVGTEVHESHQGEQTRNGRGQNEL